jgi:hypothetical protein
MRLALPTDTPLSLAILGLNAIACVVRYLDVRRPFDDDEDDDDDDFDDGDECDE